MCVIYLYQCSGHSYADNVNENNICFQFATKKSYLIHIYNRIENCLGH